MLLVLLIRLSVSLPAPAPLCGQEERYLQGLDGVASRASKRSLPMHFGSAGYPKPRWTDLGMDLGGPSAMSVKEMEAFSLRSRRWPGRECAASAGGVGALTLHRRSVDEERSTLGRSSLPPMTLPNTPQANSDQWQAQAPWRCVGFARFLFS